MLEQRSLFPETLLYRKGTIYSFNSGRSRCSCEEQQTKYPIEGRPELTEREGNAELIVWYWKVNFNWVKDLCYRKKLTCGPN